MLNELNGGGITWEDSLDIPRHDGVQHGIYQHERDGGSEAVVVLLHGAGQQVVPLNAHSLLLEQRKVLTAKTERHWRQQALRDRHSNKSKLSSQGLEVFSYSEPLL